MKIIYASIWCKFSPGVDWWSFPSNFSTHSFFATEGRVLFCVITLEGLIGLTLENNEGAIAGGPFLSGVCGWYDVWLRFAVAFETFFLWNG